MYFLLSIWTADPGRWIRNELTDPDLNYIFINDIGGTYVHFVRGITTIETGSGAVITVNGLLYLNPKL